MYDLIDKKPTFNFLKELFKSIERIDALDCHDVRREIIDTFDTKYQESSGTSSQWGDALYKASVASIVSYRPHIRSERRLRRHTVVWDDAD